MGGGERHLVDLVAALERRGHEVFVACREGAELKSRLEFESPSRVINLPLKNALDLKSARALSKIVREIEPDIIHAHLGRDYSLAAIASRANGKTKLILTRHVLFSLCPIHALTLARASRIIAVSQAVANSLAAKWKKHAGKIRIVHNGLDIDETDKTLDRFDRKAVLERFNLDVKKRYVVTVGDLNPLKGHEDFVRAASNAARERTDVDFVIIGSDKSKDGHNLFRLKQLVRDEKISERVHFVDWVHDLSILLKAEDVFV